MAAETNCDIHFCMEAERRLVLEKVSAETDIKGTKIVANTNAKPSAIVMMIASAIVPIPARTLRPPVKTPRQAAYAFKNCENVTAEHICTGFHDCKNMACGEAKH